MLLKSSGKLSDIVRGKGASKLDRMIWGRLVKNIYRNPKGTVVDLIAIVLSVCVNIQKYARY